MNTNIMLFRGNAAAPVRCNVRANPSKENSRFYIRRIVQRQMPARDLLVAVWRKNPASGRLECCWTIERATATDDGPSGNGLLCRAA